MDDFLFNFQFTPLSLTFLELETEKMYIQMIQKHACSWLGIYSTAKCIYGTKYSHFE